jgi:D-glucuronyl C5-epimerase C-terminus
VGGKPFGSYVRARASATRVLVFAALWLALAATLAAGAAIAASGGRAPGATRRAGRRPRARTTVTAALQALERRGAIAPAEYSRYEGAYIAAKGSLRHLSGTRATELGGVLANVEAMAAGGMFVPSRLPVVFLTLERNRQWWTTKYLIGSGRRVSFPESRLVWEYYPGQGIEIQWLATFGEANGYYLAHEDTALKEVLTEAMGLATQRAGGIAWEYMFQFDGGVPPWTSGLSQGTALQALSRAWERTREQQYLTAAQQALGIFKTGPSLGVRVPTPAGAHYLEYTYAPSERILNGFIQSLVGLYEYARLTGDPLGQQLFEAGDAEARAEVPRYDTGAWSMYDQHSESNLNYHELLAEFLEHLCERTSKGEPLTPTAGQIAGDEVYCSTAKRFREDQKTPPVVALLTRTVGPSERAGVQVELSKISTVSMTITLGGKTVWRNSATVEGGKPRLLWVTPSKPGAYEVAIKAVDLAGNEEVASGSIEVRRARRPLRHGFGAHRAFKASVTGPITPPARRLPTM